MLQVVTDVADWNKMNKFDFSWRSSIPRTQNINPKQEYMWQDPIISYSREEGLKLLGKNHNNKQCSTFTDKNQLEIETNNI